MSLSVMRKKKEMASAIGVAAAVVIGFCMIKQRYEIETHEYEYKVMRGLPPNIIVCSDTHPKLYETLKRLDEIFVRCKVEYVAIAGTALGAERHGEIIPWDDDVDLGVLDAAAAKEAVRENWPEAKIQDMWFGGFKVEEGVDVFSMKRVRGEVCYEEYRARMMWPKERFKDGEFAPIRRKFGEIEINVSAHNLEYVKRAYGDDCLHKCFIKVPHSISRIQRLFYYANPLIRKNFEIV